MKAKQTTTYMAIELNDKGQPAKIAMTFKEKTILLFAGKQGAAEIPQSWRQDLSAWDGEMQLAHPYPADSTEDLAIRALASQREINRKRVLSIDDMAPDLETQSAIKAEMVSLAGNGGIEEVAKAYQAAANSTPL